MRRGTRIGSAHVDVSVDGSGINEEIVNSVDEAGPGVEKAGEEHGDRYSDGFFARLRGKFSKRIAQELQNHLDGPMGRAGTDAGNTLGENITKSLLEKIDDLGPESSKRIRSLMESVEKSSRAAEKALERVENDNGRSPTRLANLTHAARTAENAAQRLERQLRATLRAENLLDVRVSRNRGGGLGLGGKDTGLTSIDDWLRGTRFRNNAINILAKSMGGLVRGFERVALAGKKFVDNMQKAEEGASIFGKISAGFGGAGGEAGGMGLFSKAMSSIASSGPGAVVAVVAIAAGMSILVSVVNALLAALVALVATIASALVGALAVGSAGIAAFAAGVGLLTVAFTSMTDAQQKMLSNAFLPLKRELTGLGQIMIRDMVPAFSTWSANLQRALLQAVPVAQVMGEAFAKAGNILTRSFSGPGFQMFAQSLATYLPSIVTRLSRALGGFLNGALALFSALMPYVNQFAGYLAQVAKRFSNWATSAKGQNSIVDFVERALVSLHSLWDFLGAVGGLIVKVLFGRAGQNAGNSIFDSMTAAVRRFTNYISQDNRMQNWFQQGVTFASALGQTIVTVAQALQSLNESGIIDGAARIAEVGAAAYRWWSQLPAVVQGLLAPMKGIADILGWIGDKIGMSSKAIHDGIIGTQSQINAFNSLLLGPLGSIGISGPKPPVIPKFTLPDLTSLGQSALNNTSGGFKGPKKFHNPWKKWAESLIKQGPSVSAQIKNGILSVNKAAAAGILAASRATSSGDVQSSMQSLVSSIQTTGEQSVNTARSALNNAAMNLANATSKGAAKKALKQVKSAQRDLKAALANQTRINRAASILNAQRVVSQPRVAALLNGLAVTNATLADYAEARSRVATMLDDANQKLAAAIALRDDYKNQVADSIKSFGSLLSAQASVINGVEQALTANDITSNLTDRLTKIKKFQDDLRLLLAQGLSNDAYKQIVDAGVEQGSTFAEALLAGGNGSIQNVNSLVSQINGIADSLGSETSNRLYQAGVDAAQGLVDGLDSLSAQLDAAAARLGNSIALAVKNALGIRSPSRVLRDMMDSVGDGAVQGLDAQHVKVGTAASALASKIAVSPAAAARSGQAMAVSGNGERPIEIDLDITTPTEDPHAVANEVINELVGRL